MSSVHQGLTPPPDHSKAVLSVAIGVGVALVIYVVTRSTLPHVGDNLHHLPHGGAYRDGTKSICYNRPNSVQPITALPFALVPIALILLIHASQYFSHRRRVICRIDCGCSSHSEPSGVSG